MRPRHCWFHMLRCLTTVIFHRVKFFLSLDQLAFLEVGGLAWRRVFIKLWCAHPVGTLHHLVEVLRTLLERRELLRHVSVFVLWAKALDLLK